MEWFEIEYFAVVHDAPSAGIIPHGLMGDFPGVDDAEAAVTEATPLIDIDIVKIRTPVCQRRGGGGNVDLTELTNKIERKDTGYPAHTVKIGVRSWKLEFRRLG